MIRPRILLFLAALLAAPAVSADPGEDRFAAGVKAAENGRYRTAAEEWRQAAGMDHTEAAFRLGALYEEGRGVDQDHETAVRWYRVAAEAGHEPARFNLGHMFATGKGVPKDSARAVHWYGMAARNDNAHAQYALGMIHFQGGPELKPDPGAAWFWLTVAADNFGPNAFRDNANQVRRRAWDNMSEAERDAANQRLQDWQAQNR